MRKINNFIQKTSDLNSISFSYKYGPELPMLYFLCTIVLCGPLLGHYIYSYSICWIQFRNYILFTYEDKILSWELEYVSVMQVNLNLKEI